MIRSKFSEFFSVCVGKLLAIFCCRVQGIHAEGSAISANEIIEKYKQTCFFEKSWFKLCHAGQQHAI